MAQTFKSITISELPEQESRGRALSKVQMARIGAIGMAVPPGVLTNDDLTKLVDTSDEWIFSRTGIRQRHIAAKGVTTSDLGAQAARDAIAKAGLKPTDIELIIAATITPDMMLPATACLIQDKIGAKGAWGFDLNAACSGFLFALQTAVQYVSTGVHKNVLVVGADLMSTIIDYQDRTTCIIFGDGAGAAVVQASNSLAEGHFIDFLHEVDGSGGEFLNIPGGGSANPASHETVDRRMHYLHQDGKAVFKFASVKMSEFCSRLLERNGLTGEDIDVFVPHQANKRIIDVAVERIGLPPDRVIINIDQFGNTTAATLPLAMNTALTTGRLKKGDLVLLATMGAGFTCGAALMRWGY
jgi:3-oxoacyl-[acyl-carrier-protein] synthase-3